MIMSGQDKKVKMSNVKVDDVYQNQNENISPRLGPVPRKKDSNLPTTSRWR